MEMDPTRMCTLLVGLPDVTVLGVEDTDGPVRVHVEVPVAVMGCAACGARARVKERPVVELVDLPAFGRPTRLVWRKHRWSCPDSDCPTRSWTGEGAVALTRNMPRGTELPSRFGFRSCGRVR